MCGICGILSRGRGGIDPGVLDRMTDALVHRGPDDRGTQILSARDAEGPLDIGLGHRRLSIIDLAGGHQPMALPDGSAWIVYNGECYNFQQLRDELAGRGHRFRTRCDTEVLLHLYQEYGPGFVERMVGMFALAIWDVRRRRLVLARDRLGQKPLYYWHDEKTGTLAFASELKSLLALPGFPRDVSGQAVHDYLSFYYVPHPDCIFSAARKLSPAHVLVWEAGRVETRRYWRPDWEPDRRTSPRRMVETVRETLLEATRARLMSDVPLGAFLSGGIDSSLTVALMAKLCDRPVKTFSIGFAERRYDESRFARLVARHCGTEHHEELVRPRAMEVLPKLVWHFDEPFGDSSAIPSYYVSRHARRHVTVALTGDAGDETFAGYPRYGAAMASLWLDRVAGPLKGPLTAAALKLLPASAEPKDLRNRLRRFALGLRLSLCERYLRWFEIFSENDKTSLYTPGFSSCEHGAPIRFLSRYFSEFKRGDFVHRLTGVDLMTYLPCDILTKVDIASMACSLETRSPFLDHRVVELAGRIPIDQKLRPTARGFDSKRILKRAFEGMLPAQITRRRKMGFGVPIARWFRTELADYARDVLTDRRTRQRGYFRPEAVRGLLEAHIAGRADNGYRLWTLLMLELWHRRFLDDPAPTTALTS